MEDIHLDDKEFADSNIGKLAVNSVEQKLESQV